LTHPHSLSIEEGYVECNFHYSYLFLAQVSQIFILSGFPAGFSLCQAQDDCSDGCQEKNWSYSKSHLLQFHHNLIRGSSYCPRSLFGEVLDQRLSYSLWEGKFVR
jgi:hypothetical protein